MAIQTMGIIGANKSGVDMLRTCLAAGLAVTLVDRDRAALEQVKSDIGARLDAAVAKGALTAAGKTAILKRFACSTQVADLHHDDLIVATGCDDSAAMAQILKATEFILSSHAAIIACDTPTPPAASLKRPHMLIGLRLGSPDAMAPMRYPQTADETHRQMEAFIQVLRNTPAAWQ